MPTIDQAAFLRRERESILDAARTALTRMHTPHYQSIGEETVRERLSALFDMVVDGLAARDLGPIVAYAEQVATERFEAGYDLTEVQVAFNALEEATWASVLHELDLLPLQRRSVSSVPSSEPVRMRWLANTSHWRQIRA